MRCGCRRRRSTRVTSRRAWDRAQTCAGSGSLTVRPRTILQAMVTTARYKVRPLIQPTCRSTGGSSQRPVPVAGGPYSGQLAQAVQFSSSGSFDPDGTIASYHWNFGDGTSATTANPSHSYAAPGLYTATLTATDNTGLPCQRHGRSDDHQ